MESFRAQMARLREVQVLMKRFSILHRK